MLINPGLSHTIKIANASGINVVTGDEISIQVIKHLFGNKWAIGFMGRVYPAQTQLELLPEQIIRVKVVKTGSQLQFKIINDTFSAAPKDAIPGSITELMKKLGFAEDPVIKQIITALIRSEMPIDPVFIRKIREKMEKEKKSGDNVIRLLVNLLGKKIDISTIKIDELLQVLDYGSNQEQDGTPHNKQQQKRQLTSGQLKQHFTNIIENKEETVKVQQDNLLQMFNHLRGKDDSWVIIPYEFLTTEMLFTGNLRLLLNTKNQEIKKAVLIVNQTNGDKWSFFINPVKNQLNVLVFSNKKLYIDKKSESFNTLILNLQNNGVKIDDKIYDDKYFDGFYPVFVPEEYKTIDTVL